MQGFWKDVKKPMMVLAPMEDVTDVAFRRTIAHFGAPDVTWTEFTSADGLVLADEKGKRKLLKKLEYGENERPVVAQLFSSNEDHMEAAARLAVSLGFDGIDINMGCPDKKVEKQLCGSGMIKHPEKAVAIVRAAKRGAGKVPVSVKTRVGYKSDSEMHDWLTMLLREDIAVLSLHARTRNDMSKVPARWSLVRDAVALRDAMGVATYVIGNGDAVDLADAQQKVNDTGCDGVMFGRAIFGNPWLFTGHQPSPQERVLALLLHLQHFDALMTGYTSFAVMKKHFKAYISGWDHAKDLRAQLMDTQSVGEAAAILEKSVATLSTG